MFLETSAIVEYLTAGPRSEEVVHKIAAAKTPFSIGPTVTFEATLVISTKLRCKVEDALARVRGFVAELETASLTITEETAELAVAAFAKYGKGRGHPARLNFGDCFSYAMAKQASLPLLYVGEDFAKTDLA